MYPNGRPLEEEEEEEEIFLQKSVDFHQTTWHYNPENRILLNKLHYLFTLICHVE
jgi:hypothetical protein